MVVVDIVHLVWWVVGRWGLCWFGRVEFEATSELALDAVDGCPTVGSFVIG